MLILTIEVEGKEIQYHAPQDWGEVTLGKFIELCNIEIPEKLRALWVASSIENEEESKEEYEKADKVVGINETQKVFPEYYGKVLRCLTDIPQDVIDIIHGPTREQFFNNHLRHYIYSSFARYPVHIVEGKLAMYDPEYRESFKLNEVDYFLPKNLKVYGEEIPMGREKAITFAEASDIEVALREMAEGASNRLPMFVAIYCREKDKAYDEQDVLRRAEVFNDLPMEEVWRVFFCIYKLLAKSQSYIQKYSKEAEKELAARLGSPV